MEQPTKPKSKTDTVRKWFLASGEILDAWRVIPRVVLLGYGILVYHLTTWFLAVPLKDKVECDSELLTTLIDKGVDLEQAQSIACSMVEIVGGPTMSHTAFVTTICGLATGIFGLYVGTGRKWGENPYFPWTDRRKKEQKQEPELPEHRYEPEVQILEETDGY